MELSNKNIILTGASSGIGNALLQKLSKYEGVKVIAVSRNMDNNLESKSVYPFAADLSSKEGVNSLFGYAKETIGTIDIFIANAGFAYIEELSEADWEHVEDIFSLNVTSVIYSLQKFNEQNIGKIRQFISTSSAVAFVPLHAYALYCSSKSALHQFMEAYRYEKNEDLILTTIYPVATRTQFFDHASGQRNTPPPFPTQEVESVVNSIIKGIKNNKKRIYPSLLFRIVYPIGRAFPILLKLYSRIEKQKTMKWLRK